MKKEMKIGKKIVVIVIVSAWSLFSVAYIANDIWEDFKTGQINAALQTGYDQGVTYAVNQAIISAENEKCEPFSIYDKNKGKNVEVINIKCLQASSENTPEQK